MPTTDFEVFGNGDVIEAEHINELHEVIQNLERGKSFYAGTSGGSSTAYTVTLDPAPDSPHLVGMIVHFKVHTDNTAGSPDVTLNVNSVGAKPILKGGGDSLAAGDLKAGQMVACFYDSASGGSFKLIGGGGGSSGIVPLSLGGTARDNSGNNLGMGVNVFQGGLSGGSHNTGIGHSALYGATGCTGSTALGTQTAYANTTGSYQVAIGYQAGLSSTTGTGSTAVGYGALYTNTANYNTALGYAAGYNSSSGTSDVFVGNESGYSNTSGSGNTMCGSLAGRQNTTGSSKTCLGASSGFGGSSNDGVTALGYFALQACTASYNTAAGYVAGYNTTSGAGNSFFGQEAAYTNTTGGHNSAFGTTALRQNSTGSYHTSMGHSALYAATGAGCVGVGYNAGSAITSGNYNTILGYSCATNLTTGSNCIAIGDSVSLASATESGQVNIGNTFRKTGTQQSASVTSKGQSYANSSDTTILSLSNRRGRIEFFDSNNDWAIVRFMGTGTPVIESGSAAWVVSGSPASGEVGLNVSGSNLQMVLGSSAARTIGWVVRDVEF